MKNTIVRIEVILLAVLFILPTDNIYAGKKKEKELEAKLATCNQEKSSMQVVLDETVLKLNRASEEKESAQAKNLTDKAEIDRLQSELSAAPFNEYDDLQVKYAELQQVKDKVINTLDERITLKDQSIKDLESENLSLKDRVVSLQVELSQLRASIQGSSTGK